MRPSHILRLALLLSCVTSFAVGLPRPRHPGQESARPKALFNELTHDAGLVKAGSEVTHRFKVKNQGTAELVISDVKPTCGCTVADFTPRIPPGGTGMVTLTTTSPILRPTLTTSASVFTNDPEQARLLLTLTAQVKLILEVLPEPSLDIRALTGQPVAGELRIANRDRKPLRVLGVELTSQEFAARIHLLKEGQEYAIRVESPPRSAPAEWTAQMTIRTNKPSLEKIPVVVVAKVVERVTIAPERISFGKVELDTLEKGSPNPFLLRQALTVRGEEPDFKLLNAECSLPFVTLVITEPTQPQSAYIVAVTMAKERLTPGVFSGSITLRTNDPLAGELKVPISVEIN